MSPSPSFGSSSFGLTSFGSSPLFSTQDIVSSVLRATGHSNPSVETNRRQVVLDALNNRYARIVGTRHWKWLYQELGINFEAPYITGTVDVTQSSEVITGNGTLWSVEIVPNQFFVPSNRNERYMISTLQSDVELSIEGEWSGDTTTALAYSIIKPIFRLPSDCDHVRSISLDGFGKMVPIGIQEMKQRVASNPTLTGIPRYFTEIGRLNNEEGAHIEIFPAPDKMYSAHLNYGLKVNKLLDEEANFPLVPDRHRVVLYYGALSEFYRFLKDPTNNQTAENDYTKALLAMQNDTQLTDSMLQYQPRRNYKNRRRRGRIFMDRHDFAREDD